MEEDYLRENWMTGWSVWYIFAQILIPFCFLLCVISYNVRFDFGSRLKLLVSTLYKLLIK